ncbi:MAG: hypothetical protein L0H79_19510 [Intrasporangium sp.]|uniref:hypothetical protein n=1 Tax=Intrasporangium sp. TaxID=1925024 RepID=UPI00264891F0|nr:hypothetical protein [Intrasporangium sp.]MDN5797913.1 hypothetical protein [Intrasporangium sp.]
MPASSAPRGRLIHDRALAILTDASRDLAALIRRASQATKQLLPAGLILAPARTLPATEDRLHTRATGRYVAVNACDAPDLIAAMTTAEIATEQTGRSLRDFARTMRPNVPREELVARPLL